MSLGRQGSIGSAGGGPGIGRSHTVKTVVRPQGSIKREPEKGKAQLSVTMIATKPTKAKSSNLGVLTLETENSAVSPRDIKLNFSKNAPTESKVGIIEEGGG